MSVFEREGSYSVLSFRLVGSQTLRQKLLKCANIYSPEQPVL